MSQRRSRLRQLALDYADGHIDRDTYVHARTQFLDALATQTPAEDATATTVLAAPPTATAPAAPDAARRSRPRAWLPILGVGVGVLVAAGLGIWLLSSEAPRQSSADRRPAPSTTPGAPPAVATPPAAALAETAPAPESAPSPAAPTAVALIEQWLVENDWEATHRAQFIAAWHAQGRDDEASARKSHAFARLSDELRVRIETQDAAGGNDAEVAALLAFGREIGVELGEQAGPVADAVRPDHKAPAAAHQVAAESVRPSNPDEARSKAPDAVAPPSPGTARPPEPVEHPHSQAGAHAPDLSAAAGHSGPAGATDERPRAATTTATPETPEKTAKAPAPTQTEPSVGLSASVGSKSPAGPRSPAEPKQPVQPPSVVPTEQAAESRIPRPPAAPAVVVPKLPSLAERLTGRVADDPCAGAAKRAQAVNSYPCADRFSDTGAPAPRLLMVPAATPFAITDEQYSAERLTQWCSRSKQPCADDDETKAVAYAAWLTKRTGKRYRPATPADWQQAAAYGVIPRDEQTGGFRLVRELDLPTAPDEAEALEHWWRAHYRPSP